jgi:hypothetical protein
MIAVAHGAGFHARRIAAGIGLGLSETNPYLAVNHRQQKSFLLFLITVK